jgi:hypothetical protein
MTKQIALSVIETIALSTSGSALRILQKGSPELLTAFQHGAFSESEQGVAIRAPEIDVSAIKKIGTCLFLIQLDALESEMRSLGIHVKNQRSEIYQ